MKINQPRDNFHGTEQKFISSAQRSMQKISDPASRDVVVKYFGTCLNHMSSERAATEITRVVRVIEYGLNPIEIGDDEFVATQYRIKTSEYSQNYRADLLATQKRFCEWLMTSGLSKGTVSGGVLSQAKRGVTSTAGRDETCLLSAEDIKRLLENVSSPKMRVYFALLAATGARPSEIIKLRKQDLKTTNDGAFFFIELQQAKGRSGIRAVPLGKDTAHMFQNYCEIFGIEDYLFRSQRGGGLLTYPAAYHAFNEALVKAGLEGHSMYDLRHSAITQAVKAGRNLEVTQKIFWGGRSGMMDRYLHLTNSDLCEEWARQ